MKATGTYSAPLYLILCFLLGWYSPMPAQRLPGPEALTVDDGLCLRQGNCRFRTIVTPFIGLPFRHIDPPWVG